jgi:hypothetical protein
MNLFILTISLLLFGLIFWLLYELTQTAKHLTNKNYNHDRADIVQLVILLLLIILVVPFLFTLPVFNVYKSEAGSTGEIGDTIGGLTAPFINGIGAILVYLAFKEQVKATHQTRNLELYKIISDRLNWLKSDNYDIVTIENTINNQLAARTVPQHPYNKATYLLIEFEELFDIASKSTDEKENLIRQIQYLYRILYRDRLTNIQRQSIIFSQFHLNQAHPDLMIVLDYTFAFQSTDDKLGI